MLSLYMKVLIQDSQSKKFFAPNRAWVRDAQSGQDFESHHRAFTIAQAAKVPQFNIVLLSTSGRYAFRIDEGITQSCN